VAGLGGLGLAAAGKEALALRTLLLVGGARDPVPPQHHPWPVLPPQGRSQKAVEAAAGGPGRRVVDARG
jgi:hypothetical protein